MPAPVPTLQQPPGSNSCLPTAVRAVLLRCGVRVAVEDVSAWCGETALGCWLDRAIEGLRLAGLDVQELSGVSTAELCALVSDALDPQPVILIVQDPFAASTHDHAVVIVDVREPFQAGAAGIVDFMDPLTGSIEQDTTGHIWQCWDFAGGRALGIRP